MSSSLTSHPLFHDPHYPSSEALSSDQCADIDRLNSLIAANEIAFEKVHCLCGSNTFEGITTYDRYRIWQPVVVCTKCGLVQCMPRMALQTLDWFYESDFYRRIYGGNKEMDPSSTEVIERRVAAGIIRHRSIKTRVRGSDRLRRIGEIGCGGGWNLDPFHQEGLAVTGCDPSPALTRLGRSRGLDLRTGNSLTLAGLSFDLIIMSNVVEHFSAPLSEVKAALDLLAPDGVIYIEVPDMREFCLGALQSAHLYYFTPATLMHYMARIGLSPVFQDPIVDGTHFAFIFARSSFAPSIGLSGEYEFIKGLIRRFERKERVKSWLRRINLFNLMIRVRSLYRQSAGRLFADHPT